MKNIIMTMPLFLNTSYAPLASSDSEEGGTGGGGFQSGDGSGGGFRIRTVVHLS